MHHLDGEQILHQGELRCLDAHPLLAAARSLPRRLAPALRDAIKEDRLLVLSPFPQTTTRITAATARKRNEFMLTIADRIVIGHLSGGGALARTITRAAPHKESVMLSAL